MKIAFLVLFVYCSLLAFGQPPVLKIASGLVEGVSNPTGDIQIYRGIPFAAPPVGNLRWKAPQPVAAWQGVRKCHAFGPSPMQSKPAPFMYWSSEFLIPASPISEDCLYLNVWSGAKSATDKRPVIVYIPGGGFRSGGGACPIYDGEAMAKKGVVFVTINYRLGVFGFLAHPELNQESGNNTSGNYALLDMIAALTWVKKNIAAFGGDAANVTVAGQSAGASAVNLLAASPVAKGLFERAIAESGGSMYSNPLRPRLTLAAAAQQGVTFAQSLNAHSLAELRAKPADEMLNAQGGLSAPIVDGYVVPTDVSAVYAAGQQNDVPVLLGWNKDDKVMGAPSKADAFRNQTQKRFGLLASTFLILYPSQSEAESAQSQGYSNRDETFAIQDYAWANMQTKTGKAPVYLYNFNRDVPAQTPETAFGAFHSGEVAYAYDNLHTLNRPWKAEDRQLAELMSTYWVNFARTGNPNSKGLPDWPAYNSQKQVVMVFDTTSQSLPLANKAQLAFWEQYYNPAK
ncbi:carboxylesterase/lipase family protein [Spirosoma soli]|uniref:Carboxylic ester hydrolase n=1 Tax=Spirosoma soli TaxID=1770529 RepID=A0ABW5M6F5_9BACT